MLEFEQRLTEYNNKISTIDNHIQILKKEDAVSQAKIESMNETNSRFEKEINDYIVNINHKEKNLKQYK